MSFISVGFCAFPDSKELFLSECRLSARQPGGMRGPTSPAVLPPGPPGRDLRRWLQLGLAALWLFDAALQYQPFMFSAGFARMLAAAARGNPAVIAGPVTWTAHLTGQHRVAANALFGTIQLVLALGIAWRPAVKVALAASAAWALGVWWVGEGFGGLLAPGASPLTGAPGAALIYALLAVLLWPSGRGRDARFAAARTLGPAAARAIWLLLWGGLAWLSVAGAQAAAVPTALATPWSLALAAVCCLIATGVLLPPRGVRATVVLAVVAGLVMWAVGQDFGGVVTGMGTDPGTGPLLALLALAYWPARAVPRSARTDRAPGSAFPSCTIPSRAIPSRAIPGSAIPSRAIPGSAIPSRAVPGRGAAAMQITMAAAMTGMLLPRLDPVPLAAWQILAAAGTAWFTVRCLRETVTRRPACHYLPHALACGAMLYMLLATSGMRPAAGGATASAAGPAGTAGSGPVAAMPHLPVLALVLAAAMIGAVVVTTDRLPSLAPAGAGLPGRRTPAEALPPRLGACCQIAMSIAMACLLIQML